MVKAAKLHGIIGRRKNCQIVPLGQAWGHLSLTTTECFTPVRKNWGRSLAVFYRVRTPTTRYRIRIPLLAMRLSFSSVMPSLTTWLKKKCFSFLSTLWSANSVAPSGFFSVSPSWELWTRCRPGQRLLSPCSDKDFREKLLDTTRPSVNYAKDWLGQLFLIPGLVWSRKGYLWVWSKGQSTIIFLYIRPFRHGDNQITKRTTGWS